MCGLFGVVNADGTAINLDRARHARDVLIHRGPDQAGEWSDAPGVYIGHRRLSILDTSEAAQQPMTDGLVNVSINGEIYNFRPLRKELEQAGYKFQSASDSEVILHGYRHWGVKRLVERLEGMYAGLIYDGERGCVFAFRDRVGVKPFYFYHVGKHLIWASELKALCNYLPKSALSINSEAILDFLVYRYIPAPKSLYKGIQKLPAASILTYEIGSNSLAVDRYWQLPEHLIDGSTEALEQGLLETLEATVTSQLTSDVPLGLLLSGGLDSSAIAAFATRNTPGIQSFSLGFPDAGRDETPIARDMSNAVGTTHHAAYFTQDDMQNVAQRMRELFDEPFADTSAFPTKNVCAYAREKVTVVLSGDGGDELFGGYRWYERYGDLAERIKRVPWRPAKGIDLPAFFPMRDQILIRSIGDPLWLYAVLRGSLSPVRLAYWKDRLGVDPAYDELWAYRNAFRKELTPRKAAQVIDFHTYLPDDILTKVDRVSMAVSLECRPALLSQSTVEYAFSLPESFIYKDQKLKGGFRHALQELVPESVINHAKQGFSVPDTGWRSDLVAEFGSMQEALLKPYLEKEGIELS